ncbi:putative DNA topoisomerase I [Magnetofaba australis IT-1]|uniref:DNA topoisomerase 1 n=1 Tax=Magnetofaba australis IT-1 TaxID=1434232 RepID=A0A1Y2K0R2_9PROT|nr:putative DNA topoisomerase I [Magnetofaba australis IT-1]
MESPAKAKTINKFLGRGYKVVATYGHIRDLPSKNGSVDVDNGFAMRYVVPKTSSKHVEALTAAVKGADEVLLATDPDREGEAISWHVHEVLEKKKLLKDKTVKRVVFHEITKKAIQDAVANARDMDMDMVNAQQARRALDYLVGFNLSPLLWKKVRRGLSAGRVQSVALRLVCEREEEITAFKPQEYWSITASVAKEGQQRTFDARLAVADGKKLDKFSIADEKRAKSLTAAIADKPLTVTSIEKKQTKRKPAPPFITSTLQQEASRKLGFSAKKTMTVAQKLYEGLEIRNAEGKKEVVGLISYMRTDSVNLANEAIDAIRGLVGERYGNEYLPKSPRKFKSSAKNAQEAHEAIRPTDVARLPEMLADVLERDLLRLYELIWKRTVACQMSEAKIDQVAAQISVDSADPNAPLRLRATGSSVAFPGFMKVYMEGKDEVSAQDKDDDDSETMLPAMDEGETLQNLGVEPKQHFTEPPPRYTEATLVRALESFGIGRPSTYAPTMSTLQDRGYVKLEKRKFYPEDVGMVVNKYLTQHFSKYVDYNFTANLEDDLDAVSRGEREWTPLMESFWKPFIEQIEEKEKTTSKAEVTSEELDENCPECGKPLSLKLGRYGRFKACTGYPECKYTAPFGKEAEEKAAQQSEEPELSDEKCEKCGKPMLIKTGRYGKYLACSGYPDCKNNQPLNKPRDTGVKCPECGKGTFLEKKSRRGKVFYSCSGYPKCKKALWDEPLEQPCPKCGAPFVTVKTTKKRGVEHVCVAEGCDWRETVMGPGELEAQQEAQQQESSDGDKAA